MIKPILPKFLWVRMEANNKAQKKTGWPGTVWSTYAETMNVHKTICVAFSWVSSKEGSEFWAQIAGALKSKDCTEEKLKEIFKKHGIKI